MARFIYIVDSHDAARGSVHALLSAEPGKVIRDFRRGDDFLKVAATLDPGLLLLDLHAPDFADMDVLAVIKARFPGKFTVVILTTGGSAALAVEAMRAGAVDLLEKPYESETLLAAVEAGFALLAADGGAAARIGLARARIGRLSSRERAVLAGLIDGHANKGIADLLQISARTVEIYRANMMTKLNVRNLAQVMGVAFFAGLVPLR